MAAAIRNGQRFRTIRRLPSADEQRMRHDQKARIEREAAWVSTRLKEAEARFADYNRCRAEDWRLAPICPLNPTKYETSQTSFIEPRHAGGWPFGARRRSETGTPGCSGGPSQPIDQGRASPREARTAIGIGDIDLSRISSRSPTSSRHGNKSSIASQLRVGGKPAPSRLINSTYRRFAGSSLVAVSARPVRIMVCRSTDPL